MLEQADYLKSQVAGTRRMRKSQSIACDSTRSSGSWAMARPSRPTSSSSVPTRIRPATERVFPISLPARLSPKPNACVARTTPASSARNPYRAGRLIPPGADQCLVLFAHHGTGHRYRRPQCGPPAQRTAQPRQLRPASRARRPKRPGGADLHLLLQLRPPRSPLLQGTGRLWWRAPSWRRGWTCATGNCWPPTSMRWPSPPRLARPGRRQWLSPSIMRLVVDDNDKLPLASEVRAGLDISPKQFSELKATFKRVIKDFEPELQPWLQLVFRPVDRTESVQDRRSSGQRPGPLAEALPFRAYHPHPCHPAD
jgi:hypothetical protein